MALSFPLRYLTPALSWRTIRPISMFSKPGMFDAPASSNASSSLVDYIQPTLSHGLRVWWAYYWPTALIVFGLLLLSGFFMGIFIATGALLPATVRAITPALSYFWIFFVSFFTIRYVLGKTFRRFRIALLPAFGENAANQLPKTLRRTLRVWWAFIWRAVVYSVILRIAGSIALGSIIAILSMTGRSMAAIVPLAAQLVLDGAVGLFVMYSAILDEQFGDFRVALLPRKDVAPIAPSVSAASSVSIQQ